MKTNLIYTVFFFTFFCACEYPLKKETEALKTYLKIEQGAEIPAPVHYFVVVPPLGGCKHCNNKMRDWAYADQLNSSVTLIDLFNPETPESEQAAATPQIIKDDYFDLSSYEVYAKSLTVYRTIHGRVDTVMYINANNIIEIVKAFSIVQSDALEKQGF